LADVNLSRTGYGEYPQYAPFFAVNHLDAEYFGTDYYKGHSGWADGAVICPWIMYLKYNDKRLLSAYYDNMKNWIWFQEANSNHLIRRCCVWRDWLNHEDATSEELISTAFFAYGTQLMGKIAAVLGKTEDETEFTGLWNRIRTVFQKAFIKENGLLKESSQTAALLTLAFDLAAERHRAGILEQLTGNIVKRGYRLSTGFLGTAFLLPVLSKFNGHKLAGKLLEQKEFPSWLYPVLQGATTIWERWDGYTLENGILSQPMNSFNHYAYGAVASCLYSMVGGIQPDETAPGWRRFILAPMPTGTLTSAETIFDSPYGRIKTAWQSKNGKVNLVVTVPPNTHAVLRLPGKSEEILGSGEYHFEFDDPRKI